MDSHTSKISGIILPHGFDKADPLHHKLLDRLVKVLVPLVGELIVAAQAPEDFLEVDAVLVKAPGEPPTCLSALHTGLFHAGQAHALAVRLDQPLICPGILNTLLERTDPRWDVISPAPDGRPLPFPAVYATACRARLEQMLLQGKTSPDALFRKARMKVVSEKVLRQSDPGLISFLNLGQPGDEGRIRELANES